MVLPNIITGVFLILIGILCYYYPSIIKPYRNLTPERKALVDIEGLKWSLLWIMVAGGISFMMMAVFHKQLTEHIKLYVWGSVVVAFAMVAACFIATIRHNGFGKGKDAQSSRRRKTTSAVIIGSVVFTLAIFAFVVVVLVKADRPAGIKVEEGTLHVSGMYGRDFPMDQIVSMEVLDEMPAMAMRTNGSSFKNKNKGHFLTKDNEKCLLFVTYNGGPYIKLRTTDNLIYLNCDTSEETKMLIEELRGAMK